MTLEWKCTDESVDWDELSALYRAAPLGKVCTNHLEVSYARP